MLCHQPHEVTMGATQELISNIVLSYTRFLNSAILDILYIFTTVLSGLPALVKLQAQYFLSIYSEEAAMPARLLSCTRKMV